MKHYKAGPSAAGKFKSKNRNKNLDKDARYKIFVAKRSKKQYDEKKVSRVDLEELHREMVEFNGELEVFHRKDPLKPVLLMHVQVGRTYVDHVWVKLRVEDRKKLRMCEMGTRIYLQGEVTMYEKKVDRQVLQKYGFTNVRLKARNVQ